MKKISNILFWVILVSSAIMGGYMFICRFLHLSNGLQYDELYSIATAMPSVGWSTIWHEMLLKDINLPLFNILLFGWHHLFPATAFYAHLFSTLFGAAAVVAAWFLAPKTWPKLKTFIFVMLMSGNFMLVAYGTNVRAYSLSVLLSVSFTLLALRLIGHFERQEKIAVRSWLAFFILGLLGAYSHYFCAAAFFSVALVVFLYACYYRNGRAWSFFGTAVTFFLWLPWLLFVLHFMGVTSGTGDTGTWWYQTPFMLSTWEILTFLFGPGKVLCGLLAAVILITVSLYSTHGKKLLTMPEFILPPFQMFLLFAVLAVVGTRFNLWMDRYFLPFLPAMLIWLACGLYHLYTRHKLLLVLLPVLLFAWVHVYWNMLYIWTKEYNGLADAFAYLTSDKGPEEVLVDNTNAGYSDKAMEVMLAHYVPKDSKLKMTFLTKDTIHKALDNRPKAPILMILCSQIHLLNTTVEYNIEEDTMPMIFVSDTCLFTVHRYGTREGNLRKEKILSVPKSL